MTKRGLGLRAVVLGAVAGLIVGVVWPRWTLLKGIFLAAMPASTMITGMAVTLLLCPIWLASARLPFRLGSVELNLGGMKVQLNRRDAPILWRFFVEMASRIATQPLGYKEGLVEEALTSYRHLFDHARNDLAGCAPALRTGEGAMSPQAYVLQILNTQIRPLLARWHPRLERWKRTGMPEHFWSLESLCRQDIEATRQRVLTAAWNLGAGLKIAGLDQLLPPRPAGPLAALVADADLAAAEAALPVEGEAARRQIGWKMFVEMASRLPLPHDPQAVSATLNAAADTLRKDLAALPPVAGSSGAGELEAAALRLVQRLTAASDRGGSLDDTACATLAAEIAADLRDLGQVIGLRDVDALIGAAGG